MAGEFDFDCEANSDVVRGFLPVELKDLHVEYSGVARSIASLSLQKRKALR